MFACLALMAAFVLAPSMAAARDQAAVTLTVPTYGDGSHRYYHELLRQSMESIGYRPVLRILAPHLPQRRAVSMMERGELSLIWLLRTHERDSRFTRIDQPLTKGLISMRILFIPRGSQSVYNHVTSLGDFRKLGLMAGFGKGWYDARVWEANDLPFIERDGEWRVLYRQVAMSDRGVDYMPRGANEIVLEARQHPDLVVERNLILSYDRDFHFYLSDSGKKYAGVLEAALEKALSTGLMDALLQEFFGEVPEILNFSRRRHLELKTP